jgi:putrescine transport system permease protein
MRRALVLLPPLAWLIAFLLLPMLLLLAIAVAVPADGIPPVSPALDPSAFLGLAADPLYLDSFLASLRMAAISALCCLLVGYPLALAIAHAPPARRGVLLMLAVLPFWSGFLLRITAWIGLLRDGGWIDAALRATGLIHAPPHLLYTQGAVYVGITYCYLPFMVLPLYARLTRRDTALEAAAADLGAPPWRVFLRVTWPLSLPGVAAGLLLVFIPAMGEYVIPELLGGPAAETVGRVLWGEFFQNHDWPTAAALAVALLLVLLVPAALWQARQGRDG